ncbi:MAG: PEP-CTERM sorting domain-containing protein [Acidobacteriaceae bacterium]
MRVIRCLFTLMFVCAMSGMARANTFKLGVQDAPTTNIDYTGQLLDVTFGSCGFGSPRTDGCVTIANDTGSVLTSLQIDVPTISNLAGSCGVLGTDGTCTEQTIDGYYQFDITGLDIADSTVGNDCYGANNTFTIVEQGEPYRDFGPITVGPPSVTPEPASFWLLSTGILLFGGFVFRRRLGLDTLGS